MREYVKKKRSMNGVESCSRVPPLHELEKDGLFLSLVFFILSSHLLYGVVNY